MKKETLSISEKEVPKHRNALEEKYQNTQEKEPLNPDNIQDQISQLPMPSGWRLLVLPFTPKDKTKGGIYLGESTLEKQQVASQCGNVLAVGPDAYGDKERFPDGPWCKVGDWVMFARYAGSRIKIEGGEVRLLNDDEVLATIKNPEDILHEY